MVSWICELCGCTSNELFVDTYCTICGTEETWFDDSSWPDELAGPEANVQQTLEDNDVDLAGHTRRAGSPFDVEEPVAKRPKVGSCEPARIPEFDVVLGHLHTPTLGTKLWREVRREYAARSISDRTLRTLKAELCEKLEASTQATLPRNPIFWYNTDTLDKLIDPNSADTRVLKDNVSDAKFGMATDRAIKEDVKNARQRKADAASNKQDLENVFDFEGSPEEVLAQAAARTKAWAGADPIKQLIGSSFQNDVDRHNQWLQDDIEKKMQLERKAERETDSALKKRYQDELLILAMHVEQLEQGFAAQANQYANDMVKRHRSVIETSGKATLECPKDANVSP